MSESPVIRVKSPFRNREEKLLTALEIHWNEHGCLPTGQRMVDKGVVLSVEEFTDLLKTDYIQNALDVLGIKTDTSLQILTPIQLAAVQVMFDYRDGRSDTKKLRDLHISSQTWDNWLKDPVFQDYLQAKAGNLFADNEYEIDKALFLKARAGNVEAISKIHAIQGRFQTVETPKIGNVEAHIFLMKLFEVLQMFLIDQPDKLKAIGQAIIDIQSPYMSNPRVIEAVPIIEEDNG